MAEIRVGMSGWTYAPWRGIFYPPKHRQKDELAYASRKVSSIEINGTFYRLQKPDTFRQWYAETPDDFKFSVKATQYITHRLRLKDSEQALANFFASGLLCLREKLGPILWQLPPNLPLIDERFEEFMALLPQTSRAAGALAARHDKFVDGRSETDPGGDYPIRHAFEFRHSSFKDADFLEVMRRYNIALVNADSGDHSLGIDDVTADHVYVRMHGQTPECAEGYTDAALRKFVSKVKSWVKGETPKDAKLLLPAPTVVPRDVNIYFDNDAKAYAPLNAMRLMELLGAKGA